MSAASDFTRMILDFFNDDYALGYYIKETSEGTYDPATSLYTATTEEIPVRIILQDMTRNSNGLSSKFGTDILQGDKDCYMLPVEQDCCLNDPINIDTTKDRLRIGNVTYKVAVMKEANPTGGNALLYNLLLRR